MRDAQSGTASSSRSSRTCRQSVVTRCLAASHSRCSASEGRTYANPYRVAQAAAARKEQKQVGWYHFLWLGNLQAQAEYFIRCAQPKPGDIVACDWETTTVGTVPSCADKDAFPAADADGGGQQRCGEIRMPPCRVVEGRVRDVRGPAHSLVQVEASSAEGVMVMAPEQRCGMVRLARGGS